MTGEEYPCPGTADFHVMFFSSLHTMGMPFASECPWPSGPRNCGQSAEQRAAEKREIRIDIVTSRMTFVARRNIRRGSVEQLRVFRGTLKAKVFSPPGLRETHPAPSFLRPDKGASGILPARLDFLDEAF